MSLNPEELRYTKEHEWVHLQGETARIGITEYAAEQLGDVVHVELPEQNAEFEQGEAFGSVESVKSVSDVYLPLTGRVTEVNATLADNPGIINEDPYGEGWIVNLQLKDPSKLEGLMSHDDYQKFLSEEA
ncbi:MAG: glycine cleavage system protein GcvH [Deltaproteobacteria bacterium]|nr:glycine cleavage system protein GcvH [Deltaproteobacteria bacterium]